MSLGRESSAEAEAQEEVSTEAVVQSNVAFLESVYDRFKTPSSPDWATLAPRVKAYIEHLYKE